MTLSKGFTGAGTEGGESGLRLHWEILPYQEEVETREKYSMRKKKKKGCISLKLCLRQRGENLNHTALNSRSWQMGQSLKQEKQGRYLREGYFLTILLPPVSLGLALLRPVYLWTQSFVISKRR